MLSFRKRYLVRFLVILLIVSMLQMPAAAIVTSADTAPTDSTGQTVFSEEDIIVAVARHVKGEYDINSSPTPLSTQPLYNLSDSVIAYKVYMTDGSYIVVNANKDNPVIIEFSDPKMVSADSLRTLSTNKRQYYLAPGIIAEKSDTKKTEVMIENVKYNLDEDTEQIKTIETAFASMLNTPNPKLAAQHEIGLSLLNQYKSSSGILPCSDSVEDAFSFLISVSELPEDSYTKNNLYGLNMVFTWGTTGEFGSLPNVDNHCAATSAFNVALYFGLINNNSVGLGPRDRKFIQIHGYMGNGPVLPGEYRTRFKYFIEEETEYDAVVRNPTNTWANYKQHIDTGYMNIMCLLPALNMGHMVNGVGYREYSSGSNYCKIKNNWDAYGYVYTLFGTSLVDLFSICLWEREEE